MKIDAGVSFWKNEKTDKRPAIRNHPLLQQQYLPGQIELSLRRNEIDGCVAVAVEPSELETRFLSELSLTHPEIRGVVGWMDFQDERVAEKIMAFHSYAPIRGYCLAFDGPLFPGPAPMQAIGEYAYSLDIAIQTKENTLPLKNWMASYPDQLFILQNCGNPDTRHPPDESWKTCIRELSKIPQLSCKVSGLLERSGGKSWKPADFYPFLDIIFENFGVERLLFASDWPFILVSGIYVQWKSLLEKYMEGFSTEDRELFFGGNAGRLYRL